MGKTPLNHLRVVPLPSCILHPFEQRHAALLGDDFADFRFNNRRRSLADEFCSGRDWINVNNQMSILGKAPC
jgi:hypothetical protein